MPDATVVDENRKYQGTDEIRRWLRTAASEFTYTRTFVSADRPHPAPGSWSTTSKATSREVVDLRYRYTLAADLISALIIAP